MVRIEQGAPRPGVALIPLPGKGRTIEVAIRAGNQSHLVISAALQTALTLSAPTDGSGPAETRGKPAMGPS
ncbi:hypothetical protein ACFSKW_00315 [Nonomuraea mangrovi]|uniref:Uncharacterized protein n=1 Tax=Nonomuraea mangrovi TaxID=2316207 RepID=A0ABW4SN98_9ACTN